jgi:four helix bundle protein
MNEGTLLSNQLEERLIEFAARLIRLSIELPQTPAGRHIAMQILRSGTAPAPNYAEARGAESRADFIHKLGIVQKELNETCVWLRILQKNVAENPENIVAIVAENRELARIITASIKTAQKGLRVLK